MKPTRLFDHMRANRARRAEALDRIAQADRDACAVNGLAISRGMRPSHPEASNYQECVELYMHTVKERLIFLPQWKVV